MKRHKELAHAGSFAVRAVEAAWQRLRQLDPRIPPAVIVIIAVRERKRRLGHFSGSSWRVRGKPGFHEVGVSPSVFKDPLYILSTLLHEAAHASLWNEKLGGMGSGGYYHTRVFRDRCHEFGLACSFRNTRYGWTDTGWPEAAIPARYGEILEGLRRDLRAEASMQFVRSRPVRGKRLPKPGLNRLVCSCDPPRGIYASKSIVMEGPITCGRCKKPFRREYP